MKLIRFLWLLPAIAAGSAPSAVSSSQAVTVALQRNPELLGLEAELGSARARLSGASTLFQANPQLSASAGPRSGPTGNTLELEVGVTQQLEVFGQRGLRREAAEATVRTAELNLRAKRVEVAANVRVALARATAAEANLRLVEEGRRLAMDGLRAAEERLAAGGASRFEVNAARVEGGKAERLLASAQQDAELARANLTFVTGAQVLDLAPLRVPDGGAELPLDEYLVRALRERPDLAAALQEIEQWRAEIAFADRQSAPRPSVGLSYAREEAAQIVLGTVTLDLPLFQRNQAERGRAAAELRRAEQFSALLQARVQTEVELVLRRRAAAARAAAAYSGAVREALEENSTLSAEAYRAGKIGFLELLILRRETLDGRRALIEAARDWAEADAALIKALGGVE